MTFSRTRTMGTTVSTSASTKTWRAPNSSWDTGPFWSDDYIVNRSTQCTKTTQDVVTPNYNQAVREGRIIENPFAQTGYDILLGNHLVDSTNGEYCCTGLRRIGSIDYPIERRFWTGSVFVAPYMPYGLPTFVDDGAPPLWRDSAALNAELNRLSSMAIQRALSNSSLQEAAALVTLGEGRETVKYLYDKLRTVNRHVNRHLTWQEQYQKGDITSQKLGDEYLALRYALRPLYFEVKSYLEALLSNTRTRFHEKAFEASSVTLDDVPVVLTDGYLEFRGKKHSSLKCSARAGTYMEASLENLTAFDAVLEKYGATSVLESAFELMTCSFILSWFCNIGDFVKNLSEHRGVKFLSGFCTTRADAAVSFEGSTTLTNSGGIYSTVTSRTYPTPITVTFSCHGWKRYRTPITGVPPLEVIMDTNLSLFKILDLGLILKGKTNRLLDLSVT